MTLTAAPAAVSIGGRLVRTPVFNGLYVAPTLRVKPGDLLRIRLVNGVGAETNLHTHGLAVSPKGVGDNVFRIADPGATLAYEYRVPVDHPVGLYWYHPHFHGLSSAQTKYGLSGTIIVDPASGVTPATAGIAERVLVLKDAQIAGGAIDTAEDIGVNTTRTVNGARNPTIRIRPGETQLWRVSNQSANLYYDLELDGHTLYQAGRDGSRLNQIQRLSHLLLPPGGRSELLVQAAPTDRGRFLLRTRAIQTGSDGDVYGADTLATLRIAGAPVTPLALPTALRPLVDWRGRVTGTREVVFTAGDEICFVNGRLFDMNRVDAQVALGAVERWTIRNDTDEWHAFHMHQGQFQLVAVNGRGVPFDGYYDVVNVPDRGSVTVILPFTRPEQAGRFVYHCHILDHEDRGMMATIQVGPSDAATVAAAAAMARAMGRMAGMGGTGRGGPDARTHAHGAL